ncbi:MAG: FAD-binding oxidoreductase [Pseudomonadota bacterium]
MDKADQTPAPSWGRYFKWHQPRQKLQWRHQISFPDLKVLPYGLGRSYGDSCLLQHGTLLDCSNLNRLIHFDKENGILTAEAGLSLRDILEFAVPKGWFLPVTPGSQFVTLGGAIANDVHGKNHHRAGNFGHHILEFTLLRSNGETLHCSRTENSEWFAATVGGLGLTGLIVSVTIKLKSIHSPWMDVTSIKYSNFDEFCALSDSYSKSHEYTVAWVDACATGHNLGRGIFLAAHHSEVGVHDDVKINKQPGFNLPFTFPNFALNAFTVRAFNTLYYARQQQRIVNQPQHYRNYFYPLDGIGQWNKMYGSRGFLQYQCVIPKENKEAMRSLIESVAHSKTGSFLTVLKEFGNIKSLGMMSFPRPGYTFALDFANQGQSTLRLLSRFDAIVSEAQGAVYPAKDARMSAQHFRQYFPKWQAWQKFIDPAFSSSFWQRMLE